MHNENEVHIPVETGMYPLIVNGRDVEEVLIEICWIEFLKLTI